MIWRGNIEILDNKNNSWMNNVKKKLIAYNLLLMSAKELGE